VSPLRGEEFTGRTVEEAIERGLRELGKRRTDVDIEVLEKGKPANMLGLGGEDARVLLSFQEDEVEAAAEVAPDEAEVPRRPIREAEAEEVEEGPPAYAEELAVGAGVLRELLGLIAIEADVRIEDRPGREGLEVEGPDLGILIGRGGENLIALQQVVSAITSRRVGRTVHVSLDIEGYRHRREDQLREVARRVAGRVRTTGQAVTLEPMLAYERRVVHLAVQGQAGIRTESVGIEPNRRVVISSTAPGARGPAPPRQARPGAPGGFRRPGAPGGFGQRRPYGPRPGGFRPRGGMGPPPAS
jgi:spoIIIJ-associated protein